MKKLYVTDLDGTLLNPESRVSDTSAEIISRMTRRGAAITVATARTAATVEPLLKAVDIAIPAIVMTGAALWDRKAQRYTDVNFIYEPTARGIIEICHETGCNPFLYTLPEGSEAVLHTFFNGTPTRAEQKFIDQRRHLPLKRFIFDAPTQMERCMHRSMLIFAVGPIANIYAAADRLRAEIPCSVSAYTELFSQSTAYLEVFAEGVSKAAAVEQLARRIGADEITVFGDNLNDLPMMEVADRSVAVGNAFEAVKERADVVIGTNATDAVAHFIEEDF